jgi:putative ABC transport system substrate-binding protein
MPSALTNRRQFTTLLGGATAWPLAARAQQDGRMRRIAVLLGSSEEDVQAKRGVAEFTKALAAMGWDEGHGAHIDYRWAAADLDRMQTLAKEVVNLAPDVILAQTTQVTAALQRETSTIPIVFVIVSDPIGSGFVASLPRPGGNITGFINLESSLSGKWIEILKDVLPRISRALLMYNPATAPYFEYFLQPFAAAARHYAIEPVAAAVHADADIERAIKSVADRSDAGLVVMPDVSTATRHTLQLIISLAAQHRVPTIYPYRYMVVAGGLISYGVDVTDIWRRSAAYVDRILKGATPADLPVQLPTRFELAVNLKTAKALGLEMPAMLLGRADEVVE